MANLDRSFDIVGSLEPNISQEIKKALTTLEGVNHVNIDHREKKVIVGYTPGVIAVQSIKETIESQGVDVSDMGDD